MPTARLCSRLSDTAWVWRFCTVLFQVFNFRNKTGQMQAAPSYTFHYTLVIMVLKGVPAVPDTSTGRTLRPHGATVPLWRPASCVLCV